MKQLLGSGMPDTGRGVLIVDDEPSIRMSLSCVLAEIGYHVRTAEDGLSALAEMRTEVPDILLSDLNMPGMSGFELLSVVRRRFPEMKTIAMSGAFCGNEVPSGVAADGFYQKGSSMGCLLRLMDSVPKSNRANQSHSTASEPLWIQRNGEGDSGEAVVTISCPECLRSFSHPCSEANNIVCETHCVHCLGLIHYAIVQAAPKRADYFPLPDLQKKARGGSFQGASAQLNSN
jgi:CheY-like chemotaxis protein